MASNVRALMCSRKKILLPPIKNIKDFRLLSMKKNIKNFIFFIKNNIFYSKYTLISLFHWALESYTKSWTIYMDLLWKDIKGYFGYFTLIYMCKCLKLFIFLTRESNVQKTVFYRLAIWSVTCSYRSNLVCRSFLVGRYYQLEKKKLPTEKSISKFFLS